MYVVPEDCVITYDSSYVQEHVDSSEFEENCTPVVNTRTGAHNLTKQKKRRMSANKFSQYQQNTTTNLYIDCDEYPVKLKKEIQPILPRHQPQTNSKNNKTQEQKQTKQRINSNYGNQVQQVRSKLSIIKYKVIPCISSIFKRNNCTRHNMSVIEENENKNIRNDNCYRHCNGYEQAHTRKSYKRQQNYVVQPVYSIEGNTHKTTTGPFTPTRLAEIQLQYHNRKTENQCPSRRSLSSSSGSDVHITKEKQQMVDKFRKTLKSDIMKEHMKYQQNHQLRTQRKRRPSKEKKYHVFTTPMQSRTQALNYKDHCISDLPSSNSSFWEYLFEKSACAGKRYETHRAEVPLNSCTCPVTQGVQCGHACCKEQPQQEMNSHDGMSDWAPPVSCTCKEPQQQQQREHPCNQNTICDPISKPQKVQCDPKCSSETMADSSNTNVKDKKKHKLKVKCKCPPKSKLNDPGCPKKCSNDSQKPNEEMNVKPCQEGHDELVLSLAQRYNGEVLCIHNPPCILINGCLNLPPPKNEQQNNEVSSWPVTTNTKHNFYNQTNSYREQAIQYHVEVNHLTDYKAEKMIQSICHHKPPCEVVRGCHRAKYDPKLQNSCVHVPMCKQIPQCVILDRKKNSCEHHPRCRDIPICSKDFVTLTAKENIGTQVKTSSVVQKECFICRHEPPCILIPKCIGRALCDSSYVDVDAIPVCIHRPSCELIPACCRKSAKEMHKAICTKSPKTKRKIFGKMKITPTYTFLDSES